MPKINVCSGCGNEVANKDGIVSKCCHEHIELVDETEEAIQEAAAEQQARIQELQTQLEALELEKVNVIKPFYEKYKQTLDALIEEAGLKHHWQDENGIVYVTAEKTGTFVSFEPHQIQRTRFEGESKGSLSMIEARGFGYVVEGK